MNTAPVLAENESIIFFGFRIRFLIHELSAGVMVIIPYSAPNES